MARRTVGEDFGLFDRTRAEDAADLENLETLLALVLDDCLDFRVSEHLYSDGEGRVDLLSGSGEGRGDEGTEK